MQRYKLNHQISAPEVRVINEAGEQIGVLKLSEALALSEEHGLDLVEISPGAKPPVVKLIGYDKFRYQQKKMEQEQKKKAKKIEVKTIRLSPRIGQHDMEFRAKQTNEFLTDGDLVRVELRMRGREQAYANLAEQQIKTFQTLLTVPFRIEVPVKRMGPTLSMTLAPQKTTK